MTSTNGLRVEREIGDRGNWKAKDPAEVSWVGERLEDVDNWPAMLGQSLKPALRLVGGLMKAAQIPVTRLDGLVGALEAGGVRLVPAP